MTRKDLLRIISGNTRGIWVGFAVCCLLQQRRNCLLLKYFEKGERHESIQWGLIHFHRLSSPMITGTQVVGAHTRVSNHRHKPTISVKFCGWCQDRWLLTETSWGAGEERPVLAQGSGKGAWKITTINHKDFSGRLVPSVFRCFCKSQPQQYTPRSTRIQTTSYQGRWNFKSLG